MADLKITELQALAGANLAAADELAVADISASETKKITVSDLIAFGADLISNAEIPSAKISFAAGSIVEASLAAGAVTAAKIGSDAVTATKLADQSTCIVAANLAALQAVTGDFVGQLGFTTDNAKIYLWQNSTWNAVKAAGSINTISADTSGIVNITVSTSGDTATVGTSLDNTSAAGQFLAGPTGSAGAVGYRAVVGTDLPVPTTTTKGAIAVNGEGLRMDGDRLEINNDVTLSATHHVVTYDAKGLINGGRTIISADLPAATSGAIGAVTPGTGLSVNGAGALNHTNVVTPGTYAKITFDAQGHVSAGTALADTDLPNHSAALLTSGTLNADRIASNAITAAKLADYATTTIGNAPPAAEHIGQFFFNPLERTLFLWDGNVYQPVGISAGEIVFSGTYDASVNQVDSVTTDGAAIGLVAGQALPAAGASNRSYYVVVSQTGTGTTPAPAVTLEPPDILLSNGTSWVLLEVSETVTAQLASNVQFSPTGDIVSTNVQSAIAEVDSEKLPKAGGTMTGNLELGQNVALVFEGSTADGNETTLTVANPTADRTITLPNVSGTVVTTGDTGTVTSTMIADATIVDADISASAEIAVSKLADGTPRQLLQTDAAGTGVEWASNIDIPGTLDVTSAATFDSSVAVTGALTKSGNNVVTVGDTGTVTSSMIADGTIVDADINAGAEIAVSKLADGAARQLLQTDAAGTGVEWASNIDIPGTLDVTSAATFDSTIGASAGTAALPSITFTGDLNTGIYSPGADQVAVATNGAGRLGVASNGDVYLYTGTIFGPNNAGLSFSNSANTAYNSAIKVGADNNLYLNDNSLSNSVIVRGASGERLRITSAGLVGIGTSSPGTLLDVVGGVGRIRTGGKAGSNNFLKLETTDASNSMELQFGNSTNQNWQIQAVENGVNFRPLILNANGGNVGIGTTSPSSTLTVGGNPPAAGAIAAVGAAAGIALALSDNVNSSLYVRNASGGAIIGTDAGGQIRFATSGNDTANEKARLDNSGRLLVGTSTSVTNGQGDARLQVTSNSSNYYSADFGHFSNDAFAGAVYFKKSRSTTAGGFASVANGDTLGDIRFAGADGTNYIRAALIECRVDGTPGTNDMPGRLVFSTTADGASSPTERMRITNAGNLLLGATATGGAGLRNAVPLTGNSGNVFGFSSEGQLQPDAVTARYFHTQANTAGNGGTPYTITAINHINIAQSTFNADSTVTNQFGVNVASTLTGATNNYGFYGNIASGTNRWNFYANGTAANRFNGNVLIGGTIQPASATLALCLSNGTAPTGSITDGVVLYAEDVSSSSELKVRDEAGNVTTLSPHNFDLIPDGPSEDMAWSYYSERDGKRINVDMLKAIRLLEQISGEKLVYSS